jgi:hypothetical protein
MSTNSFPEIVNFLRVRAVAWYTKMYHSFTRRVPLIMGYVYSRAKGYDCDTVARSGVV